MTALWLLLAFPASLLLWFVLQKLLRRTHAVPPGLAETVSVPHRQEWELYHNDFSLCSKKIRVCLAELGIDYHPHHIDLVETAPTRHCAPAFCV